MVAADASNVANRNGDGGVGELELHPDCPSLTVAKYEAGYPASLDAWGFSAMLSHGRNKTMFGRREVRCDTGMNS